MMELTSDGDSCLVESTPKEVRNSMRGLEPQPKNLCVLLLLGLDLDLDLELVCSC